MWHVRDKIDFSKPEVILFFVNRNLVFSDTFQDWIDVTFLLPMQVSKIWRKRRTVTWEEIQKAMNGKIPSAFYPPGISRKYKEECTEIIEDGARRDRRRLEDLKEVGLDTDNLEDWYYKKWAERVQIKNAELVEEKQEKQVPEQLTLF